MRVEHALALRPRPAPRVVEQQVVLLGAPGEILAGVVDDVVGAERLHEVGVSRAAHRGHFRAERFRDLHGEGPDASRRTIDQNLLPRLELSLVAQTLERGERRRRHGRRLFERQVSRLQCDGASASAGVLRECAALPAEHLVTRLKLAHVATDRFDRPREVAAEEPGLRLAQAHLCAPDVQASEGVPIPSGHRSGVHADEDAVVCEVGLLDLPELQNLRRAVRVANDRLHRRGHTVTTT